MYKQTITLISLLLLSAVSVAAQANTEDRLKQLEEVVQQMQQQRDAQNRQIESLTRELAEVKDKLQQPQAIATETDAYAATDAGAESTAPAKRPGKGSPVTAAFKDGLVFEDETGNWKLQLNGRLQADYRAFDPTEWKDDTWAVRRARLGATFSFLKDFLVRVEGEYANDNAGARGTTALTYGYVDYSKWKGARIRAGQFKPFFGLERPTSSNFVDFTELSLATNNGSIFTSTYDRGVMLFGDPLPWLNYNVYAVNGTGQNNDDQNDGKDIGGRINGNLASLMGIKNAVIHAGASISNGDIGRDNLGQTTEGVGTQFFRVTGLNQNGDRDRWGLETALAYGPIKLQAEYIDANFEGAQGTTQFDNDIKAWYADLNWLVTGEAWADAYKSGIFGRIVPKRNFDDKEGWGAFEVGVRYSRFDASGFRNMLASATANASEAHAWTLGAKWILNPNARLVLNYVRTEFDEPAELVINGESDDTEQALVLRAQYDF